MLCTKDKKMNINMKNPQRHLVKLKNSENKSDIFDCFSTRSSFSEMPLNKDIRKATSLNWRDKNAEFLRLQGLSQAERDRKMNEKKVTKPKNIHLVETCDQTDDEIIIDTDIIVTNEVNRKFDRHEVSAAIKEVNGGVDLSNKYWEQYWSNHLVDAIPPVEELERFSLHSDVKTPENYFKDKDLFPHRPIRNINLTNRLRKNAAIMGLVKIKNISLEEMIDPNYNDFAETKNKLDNLHQHKTSTSASNGTTNNAQYHIESIPLPDDPEIFVHPLQMGLDKKKFQDIDFSLPRLGKKVIVSPPEFFLGANKDEFFDFVKSHKKDET